MRHRHRSSEGDDLARSSRRVSFVAGVVFSVTVWSSVLGAAGTNQHGQHAPESLGHVVFEVSCSDAAASEFQTAVALLHHMTYPQARAAFQRVASLDPECAMAHWGIAMTLFQPLWPTRPGPAELRRGWEAVREARALKPPTERERLFIDAAAAFYREPESRLYWDRIRAWESAMEEVLREIPADPEASAFFALAHLAVAPADGISLANSERAAELLLKVYEQNPDHPGAMHYLIHANDVPGREAQSLEIVRKYDKAAPNNPHALHMPTHIYTRLGDWDAVIRGNIRAAEAALAHPAGEHGELVWDEFPHAIEYLVYAYLQEGADEEAAAQVSRLHGTSALEPTFKTAFHLASTKARYALERQDWEQAARIEPRQPSVVDWDRFPWPESVSWFARGLGSARIGRSEEAIEAGTKLRALSRKAQESGEELFARHIRVLALGVEAWLAHAGDDADASLARMREAAELEASTPKHAVTPGPTLPAHELLGDLLLAQGSPKEALAAYERSLELYPRRFNSVLGAARAARASGDRAAAARFYRQLVEGAAQASRRASLEEAREFLRSPAGEPAEERLRSR